jgi:hypothetical protein
MIDPKLGAHHKDQLLAVLFNYMGQDLRQRLMLECPAAYNAACGREVVKVVRGGDGSPVVPDEFRVTRVVLGNAPSDPGCGTCRLTQLPA